MSEPNERVALVTGAGNEGGLGAALAIDLAAQGFAVMVHFHRSERGAEKTVAAVRENGGRAEMAAADLSIEADAIGLATAVQESFGRLDVLVNNAGVYGGETLANLSEEQWRRGIARYSIGGFFTMRACLPMLRAAQSGGRVINIGDGSCDRPGARDLDISYHIGKTGVWMLTRSFAKSEAGHGVAVNMVSPGLLKNSVGLEGNAAEDGVPAGRYGTFEDVSEAVRFFANAESTYLTGSNLSAGGGWNL